MNLNYDIRTNIVSFLYSIKDILSFKHINKDTFYEQYKLQINSYKTYQNILFNSITTNSFDKLRYNLDSITHLTLTIKGGIKQFHKFRFPKNILLPNVEYLHINYIYTEDLKKLTNLKTLKCGYLCGNISDKTILKLPKLIHLECASSKFTDIILQHLPELRYLLIYNQYSRFTINGYKYLTKLEYLRDIRNKTWTIPKDIFNVLPNIKELICDNTYTDDIIINKTNLICLDCGNSHITNNSIQTLTNLTLLNVSYQNITDYTIMHLTKLTRLYCSTTMSGSGLYNLTNLTSLSIFNNFDINDSHITHLTNLTELYSNINLTDEALLSFPKLEVLHCGYNNNFTIKGLTFSKHLRILNYISYTPNDIRTKKYISMLSKLKKTIKMKYLINSLNNFV
jgi:hypothetical protein